MIINKIGILFFLIVEETAILKFFSYLFQLVRIIVKGLSGEDEDAIIIPIC